MLRNKAIKRKNNKHDKNAFQHIFVTFSYRHTVLLDILIAIVLLIALNSLFNRNQSKDIVQEAELPKYTYKLCRMQVPIYIYIYLLFI